MQSKGAEIYELAATEYSRIQAIIADLEYHLSIQAVIDGTVKGRIWVDNALAPQATFIITPEGQYLAGASAKPAFHQALADLFSARTRINVAYSPASWEAAFTVGQTTMDHNGWQKRWDLGSSRNMCNMPMVPWQKTLMI